MERSAPATSSFDHVPFGVRDVDVARAALARLGLTTTAVGRCRWNVRDQAYAARCASVVFASGYLDLIEIQDPAWDSHLRASPLYSAGFAPTGLVVGAQSAEQARDELASRGVAVARPYDIVRELPGAEPAAIGYHLLALREPALSGLALIEDGACGAMRTKAWLAHPSSATGIRGVHLRVASLDAWRARAALVFGTAVGAAEIDLGGTRLMAHERLGEAGLQNANRESGVPGVLASVAALLPESDRVGLLAIDLSVADVAAAQELLHRNQIAWMEIDGGIAVAPTAGYGCALLFTRRG